MVVFWDKHDCLNAVNNNIPGSTVPSDSDSLKGKRDNTVQLSCGKDFGEQMVVNSMVDVPVEVIED